ncbi:unnamed protein product [Dimorphilus gyrociliatus]|uniref:Uncharacterized protein n=1 Tax=Dimorphilus gyrociliatus TaxID=2664684 RepID=A0A7I8VC12_9ANNE|nr:unnamed protein product [Dimorphilus gyrociliatus]
MLTEETVDFLVVNAVEKEIVERDVCQVLFVIAEDNSSTEVEVLSLVDLTPVVPVELVSVVVMNFLDVEVKSFLV